MKTKAILKRILFKMALFLLGLFRQKYNLELQEEDRYETKKRHENDLRTNRYFFRGSWSSF